jgi:hypothetical protein
VTSGDAVTLCGNVARAVVDVPVPVVVVVVVVEVTVLAEQQHASKIRARRNMVLRSYDSVRDCPLSRLLFSHDITHNIVPSPENSNKTITCNIVFTTDIV